MGKATREAYGAALVEVGAENKKIVVLDADLSKSTKTDGFKKAYPDRFFNVGIAEQNLISVGAGLAAAGKIPFVSSFAMFAVGRAFEQVRNAVCYPKLNVKICATHAGLTVGEDGATHQSLEDIACMRAVANMTVVVPADAAETKAVIKWAANYVGPVYVRLGRAGVEDVTPEGYEFKPGKATTLRDGEAATIIACGALVGPAMEAAETLASEGIDVRVINMASIKPLDVDAVAKAAKETGAIVTAEEHNIYGGLGAAVAEAVTETVPVPVERVGVKDTFGESGTPKELMAKYGLSAEYIVAAVRKVLERKL
ncbi:MAG: transketolase family protein [Veillonella sp.]|nr:transketolase family protein [Veillonella sp.]MBP9624492.1 transketolase family protein [Veillonella sp.]